MASAIPLPVRGPDRIYLGFIQGLGFSKFVGYRGSVVPLHMTYAAESL